MGECLLVPLGGEQQKGSHPEGMIRHRWKTGGMLELRPNCECCDVDLPPQSLEAMICTFECTWCTGCVKLCLGGRCPNCGGDLQRRPIRPAAHLTDHPASTQRVMQAGLHRA